MDQYKMLKQNNKESGQIIVVLLLIVVVVLAIGLSVVGRSNTEVLTAAKIENSARAFSAAEAGIEQSIATSLNGNTTNTLPSNSSSYNVTGIGYPNPSVVNIEQQNIGGTPDSSNPTPFAFAQFWFADPKTLAYKLSTPGDNFNIYFGNQADPAQPNDWPAVEVHVIYKKSGKYGDVRYYVDSNKAGRNNSLSIPDNTYSCNTTATIPTEFGPNEYFLCKFKIIPLGSPNFPWDPINTTDSYPILARVRVLYSPSSQNVAIGPADGSSLFPPQMYVYSSVGTSGDSQRTVQVTRDTNVMPYLFDFALYSDNSVSK